MDRRTVLKHEGGIVMTEDEFKSVLRPTSRQVQVRTDDAYIINSLMRCGIDSPTVFSLIWGTDLAYSKIFPPTLEKIVLDMIQEEEKKKESYDSDEKKLHQVILDLLQVMYEIYVKDLVKVANTGVNK